MTAVTSFRSVEMPLMHNCQSAILSKQEEMQRHRAWHGTLSGMKSEAALRGLPAGTFLLRQGESELEYYLSWIVDTETNVYKHQPFCLSADLGNPQWEHRNCLYTKLPNLDDIIAIMMHSPKEQCIPLSQGY